MPTQRQPRRVKRGPWVSPGGRTRCGVRSHSSTSRRLDWKSRATLTGCNGKRISGVLQAGESVCFRVIRGCMPPLRVWVVGCFALSLAGCIGDGWYIVKGHVRTTDEPVQGAIVRVSPGGKSAGRAEARVTGADGSFELQYRFSGMFPFSWSDGCPRVEVEAPGFTPVAFPLRGTEQPGVVRGECGPRFCFDLDIAVQPLATDRH
jgi:hypothetical protein